MPHPQMCVIVLRLLCLLHYNYHNPTWSPRLRTLGPRVAGLDCCQAKMLKFICWCQVIEQLAKDARFVQQVRTHRGDKYDAPCGLAVDITSSSLAILLRV
eukprot:scpid89024/ scgid7018/ 